MANKPSSQKLIWTPELINQFEVSKKEAKNLDVLYQPDPNDQLVLSSDYSKKGISGTLWAVVDDKYLVVSRMSAKLQDNQVDLLPCDGEAIAHYIAAKCPQMSTPIKASNKRTISLIDNKPVYEASKFLEHK